MKSQLQNCIMLLFLLAPVMFCQNSPLPNGVHKHDGFFLRLVPGFGYSQISIDDISFSGGFTFANTIQIGGTVSDNLIIFGDIGGVNVFNPSVKVNDEEVDNPGDVRIVFGGVGPGITYYFMPENIYIAASILLHFEEFYLEDLSGIDARDGFGFNLMVGKEWWVGEQWGLGVSLYLRYGSQSDSKDLTISSYSFGALFSVTFN